MSDWNQRTLCPDGGCVGLIGPDGTCKVCGRVAPNWGDERNRGLSDPDDEDGDEASDEASLDEDDGDDEDYEDDGDGDEDDGDEDEDDGDDEDDDEDDEDGEDHGDEDGRHRLRATSGDWTERTLCPDGGCIGVIGADNKCKVCGRSPA